MADLGAPDTAKPPRQPPPVAVGHEIRDVRFRPIVLAGAGLLVAAIVAHLLMYVLLGYFAARESRASAPASPLAGAYGLKAPPEPRLQTAPLADLERLRAAEDAALNGYGWSDRDAGVARIPIDRAIDLLAARAGHAAPQPNATPPAAGSSAVRETGR